MRTPRLILVSLLLLSLLAASTRADSAATRTPQRISGETPLPPPDTPGHCGTGEAEQNWEQDNSLSRNPANSKNLAVAWIQDWADAIVVGYSKDGGATWTTAIPRTTPCTGGLTQFGTEPGEVSVIDPSLSFGPDGKAYLTSVLVRNPTWNGAVVSNTSIDGGATWSDPKVLDTALPGFAADTSSVVADPAKAGVAYAKWNKMNLSTADRTEHLARTTDGGETWAALPPVSASAIDRAPVGGQLLVLRDGTLVSVTGEVPPQPEFFTCRCVKGPYTAIVRRLENPLAEGSKWSTPVQIPGAAGVIGIVGASVGPDGETIVAAWPQPSSSGESFQVMLSTSVDGGRSWTAAAAAGPTIKGPVATGNNGIPATPAVAVAADGMVGVMFYDHRLDEGSDPPRATDVWLRYSRNYLDGGASWREDHLAGSFDKRTAPLGVLGDYNGITPFGRGFAVTFSAAEPLAAKKTDIFFSIPIR